MKTRPIIWTISLLAINGFAAACLAGEWLTGPELIRHFSDPVDLVWSENPLRDALASLARVQNVAVLLDRRVDPGRKITLSLKQSPLGETLAAIAMAGESSVTLAGPVAYFGPAGPTAKLRTLIFFARRGSAKIAARRREDFLPGKTACLGRFFAAARNCGTVGTGKPAFDFRPGKHPLRPLGGRRSAADDARRTPSRSSPCNTT